MPAKNNNPFTESFPPHEHRRVHILLGILAFLIVVGSVVVYQIRFADRYTVSDMNDVERQALFNSELTNRSSEMKEAGVGQNPLTSTQLQSIVDKIK